MQRLIDKGLLHGDLLEVTSETLRDRYNRALEILVGRRTTLERFHVDLTGYSPEVAGEFDNPFYLNPHGCNRNFILLTLEQAGLPIVEYTFSSTQTILRQFIEDNRQPLFALTLRDAIYGELENSVCRVDNPEDVLSIKNIRIEINSTSGLIAKSRELEARLEAFEASDEAWCDDQALDAIVALAKTVGDIRRNPLLPSRTEYKQGTFFTTHCGGLYVLREGVEPAIILCGDWAEGAERKSVERNLGGLVGISIDARQDLARYLMDQGLVTSIDHRHGRQGADWLRRRLFAMLIDHATAKGIAIDPARLKREDKKRLIYSLWDELPDAYRQLSDVVTALEQGDSVPEPRFDSPGYFYRLVPRRHPDRELIAHLLTRLSPMDLPRLFHHNREAFLERYGSWPDRKRSVIAELLVREAASPSDMALPLDLETSTEAPDDAALARLMAPPLDLKTGAKENGSSQRSRMPQVPRKAVSGRRRSRRRGGPWGAKKAEKD